MILVGEKFLDLICHLVEILPNDQIVITFECFQLFLTRIERIYAVDEQLISYLHDCVIVEEDVDDCR